MILYHGSNVEVNEPQIVNARKALDFGAAFYTTSDYEQAKKWARLKTERTRKGHAVVSIFEFDDSRKTEFNIRTFKEPLIKSRLTAWHAICLHIFRHIAQEFLERRQPSCGISAQSDEKSDCASCAPDLISVSLILRIRNG